ncbi:hypothetical protein HYT01_00865 [Candidatus Giovannonibacteria bacterium]|nr:hypothetical protein [Candidatus Giovannonibacteria bacterium]
MWYRDAEQFMKESGHNVNGQWFPRVTKILSIKSKPAIDMFMKEMESYAAAEEVKMRSAEEGTRVHEAIQKTAVGEPYMVTEEMRPVVEAFEEFNKTRNIFFHPEFVERSIWSGIHKYSGTVDALASIDGKFGVLDIKTSTGFYSDYNLQTAAYVLALQEREVKNSLALPKDIQTRWILRVDQVKNCMRCGSTLREKGGRNKVRTAWQGRNAAPAKNCGSAHGDHFWGPTKGVVELREFPYPYRDIKAFLAAKTLWEWENDYWLRQIGYLI